MTALCELSAVEMRRLIGSKEISPVELLESCIERIEATDGRINAVPIRDWEGARHAAKVAEQKVLAGEALGPLHGLPVLVKDLSHVAGMRTTFGSRIYKDLVADRDDVNVADVRAAGAIIAGKTNTTEFGAGSNTTNDVFGPTRNPFDLARTSGGSSGGSAAALAADMAPLCTGSDTGGSLRIPSAFCGTVALRPTLGSVPNERRAFAQSPFQVLGPMARSVADAELLFTSMARGDGSPDPMSRPLDRSAWSRDIDLSTLRVAVSADLGIAPTGRIVRSAFDEKVGVFGRWFGGCERAHPDIASAVDVNWVLRIFQFRWTQKDHYAKHRDLLGPLVIENYERGGELTVEQVAWAKAEQMRVHRVMDEFLRTYDLLIVPVATIPPWSVEHLFPPDVDGQVQETHVRWASLTNALSVMNCPVVALPCGRDATGMPFGVQLVARAGTDYRLLAVARALEGMFEADPRLKRPRLTRPSARVSTDTPSTSPRPLAA